MILDFENFRLAVRPHKDVLQEEMYVCEVDGHPADYAGARRVFDEEKERMSFFGRSGRLIEQAAFFHSMGNESLAQTLLDKGLEWAQGERQVAVETALSRTKIEPNREFEKTKPWVEMKKVDELAAMGEQVTRYIDYPLVEVAWAFHGWNVKVGKPEFISEEANQHADLVVDLIGVGMTIDRMCAPEDFDKKYKPEMRVSWYRKNGGTPEWGGKELFALGIIRPF